MSAIFAQEFTRGVGIYPGDPKDDFGPVPRADAGTYRNIALHRSAYHSSAYDYNLTAQLVTDGIKDTKLPRWIAASTSDGELKKYEREWVVDNNPLTGPDLKGPRAWVQLEMGGGEGPIEVDRIDVDARSRNRGAWRCVLTGSDDGQIWREAGRANGINVPGPANIPSPTSVAFTAPSRYRLYRANFEGADSSGWHVGGFAFFRQGTHLGIGGPYDFTSAWKSAGAGEEWVKVDLGAPCTFDRVALYWIRRATEGAIELSDDGTQWTTVQALRPGSGMTDDFKLARPAKGRWVRVRMTKAASPDGYILSELEVYGRGGMTVQPKPMPATHGRMELAGGAWRLQRGSLVTAEGAALSRPGFADADWLPATVPGTVLTSYYNAGAVPDPNFGDNQLMISDSFFYADFWYRDEFVAPPAQGRRVWLNFDGINWKADVFLNGEKIGRIEGGFRRGRFDVTGRIREGQTNALAVRVEKNATPGSVKEKTFQSPDKNGGALGADNPTFHASIGWDWIPTVRGRDTGIWNRVYLTTSGPVTIEDPFVNSQFPAGDTSRADISVEVTLRNHQASPVNGTLRGRFGDMAFDQPVTLSASGATTIKVDPLRIDHPKLWWPAGYGDPDLYPVELRFETADGHESDLKTFQAGVRQFTYTEEGNRLRMWINGRRLIPRGGNWGFGESMLRYRSREYDASVRYHADMHFNMIRNWVGQIGEDEFYEACDRHGVVVWQDFWLANPYDGPDPDNDAMFLDNAKDTLMRIRNHASIGLYVGRNEGFPPKALEDGLQRMVAEFHPGIHYIPSSADDVVSGHGPYQAMPPKYYFTDRATPMFHSEMGMPNIVTMDSLKLMMPESAMWPQGDMWGLHDFSLNGAQGGRSFRERIERSYGGASGVAEWVELAQFVNYEGYRGMFEGQSKYRMGLLIWMSHPCWPSFVWQTYDYYLDPTAAYFGSKKASEPLHIQWNPATDNIEVVNYSAGGARGLTAHVELLNMDGSLQWEKSATVDSAEDSMVAPIRMEYPSSLSAVHFLRLTLSRGGEAVSQNFYWRGTEEGNYRAIRDLPNVQVTAATEVNRDGDRWLLTTRLENPSKTPALMVHVKVVREKRGDRILPALFSDNYVALMPGERRTITAEVWQADTRGETPRVVLDGFHVSKRE